MRAKQWRQGVIVGVSVLASLWLLSLMWGLVGKAQVAMSQAKQARAQYAALEARKASLESKLDALATPLGQDAAIRTAFGVARPGEEVIVVVPPVAATSTPPVPWWRKVLNWF